MSTAAGGPADAGPNGRPLRVLTFTTLFPNAERPGFGVFVENRLRKLVASGAVEARVVAPVPWFPLRSSAFGRYATLARVPAREVRHGIEVHHPRYLAIPKIGTGVAPRLLAVGALAPLKAISGAGFEPDLIDAHYFYPDGVAAVRLAAALGKPVTITARGTDLNLIADRPGPRRRIQWAAANADGLITVCRALKDKLVALGVEAERVRVLRNGVDLDLFRPVEREEARRRFGIEGPTLVSVGYLIARKGHDLTIRALGALSDAVSLVIAGEGPERRQLEALARSLGLGTRVRFLGNVAHEALPALYSAAEAMVLASSREGWANVLLEAMACGTPVVATNIWGTPEVVTAPAAGRLADARTPQAIAAAITALLADPPDRAATRAYAEGFDWRATTEGQIALFREILARRAAARPAAGGYRAGVMAGARIPS